MTLSLAEQSLAPQRARPWRRRAAGLFSSPGNTIVSLVVAALLALGVWWFLRWAIFDAAWTGGAEACKSTLR